MAEWRNWSGGVTADPEEVVVVRDVPHLQLLCEESQLEGRGVKAIGSGHSFTAIGQPRQIQVRLDRLSGIVSVDEQTHRVWVRGGTPLHLLTPELHSRGLALANMGDIDRQTISGALSTGTHGTGLGFTGFGGMVTGIEMVLADGSVLRSTQDEEPDLLPALSVGLGALGIVTAVELQCVPRFLLRAHEAPSSLGEVLDGLDDTVEREDHFEFYWFPHTDRVLTKTNTRVHDEDELAPLPSWRRTLDDDLLSNKLFEGVNRVVARVPALAPRINQISARALTERTYTDWSPAVFATARDVRFNESEYAVPREAVPSLLRELAAWTERRTEKIAFPVEVRFAAADDRWLSTAYGRETGYVAVHQYARLDYRPYFTAFWSMLRDHGARPHWGKLHDLEADELATRYPKFGDFVALRDRLDPQRVFGNDYLDRVLG